MKVRNWRLAAFAVSFTVIALGMVLSPRHGEAQSCQSCGQCMGDCVCQADGSCTGTPQTGTACDDLNDCTTIDTCQAGVCTGTPQTDGTACDDFNDCTTIDTCQAGVCMGGGPKANGDPCTFPGLGKCATGQCLVEFGFAFCQFSLVTCDNKCHFCNPDTGLCTISMPCGSIPCTTSECNPSTGCIPGHEGEACDDGNVCTTNTQCQAGLCKSGAVTTPMPTATATPTHVGPTPTQPVGVPCIGDCGNDGQVTVDEILTMVNIALGNAPVSDCEAGDGNGDHQITVDEILTAVNYALSGCPVRPSAARRSAGAIESSTKALMVLPNLLSALLGPASGAALTFAPTPGTGSAAFQFVNTTFTCPSGGGTLTCDQVIGFPLGPPTYGVTLNNCQVAGATGTTLTFNGALTAVGKSGDICGTIPADLTVSTLSLTMQSQSAAGSTTTTFTNFSAGLSLSDSGLSGSCIYDTVDLKPSGGTISVATTGPPATSTQLTFNSGSDVSINVSQYGAQCVPQIYNLELNGVVTLVTDTHSFQATYTTYDLFDDTTATPGQDTVDISGTVDSPCFGGAVDLSTFNSLSLNGGACPTAGAVEVTANGNTDLVSYTGSGGVTIDLGEDGTVDQTFPTCLDPALFVCPVS